MIIALAGRRIDAPDMVSPRFPLQHAPMVRERIRALLVEREATGLVCAAACGADLLALAAAGTLGLRRRIVLPFAPDRFRDLSVTDRPGEWGPLFDSIVRQVEAAGDLMVLDDAGEDEVAFTAVNRAILDEALALGHGDAHRHRRVVPPREDPGETVRAVIVWDGKSRGEDDVTAAFAREAGVRGLAVDEVSTR